MRKLNILKTLIDLFFYFSIFAIAGMLIFTAMVFFTGEGESFPMKINGSAVDLQNWQSKILLCFAMASAICFLYAIHLLRKVIRHFVARQIFNDAVIRHFNGIGINLIASAVLMNVPLFIYNALLMTKDGFEFSTGGFDSFTLAICLGLFFMVLSEIFKVAKNIKDENELTV